MSFGLLSPSLEPDEPNPIATIWSNVKEVFGFLAQHPQLMGLGFIILGWFIKQTRGQAYAYVPTGRQGPPDPRYPPGTDPYLFERRLVDVAGLDLVIVDKGFSVMDPRAPVANFLAQFIPEGALRDFLLPKSGLGSVDLSGSQWVGVKITLGDLLTMAGLAGLFGPSLSQFIPKL